MKKPKINSAKPSKATAPTPLSREHMRLVSGGEGIEGIALKLTEYDAVTFPKYDAIVSNDLGPM